MDAFNLSHFSACMYPCIIAKQGLHILCQQAVVMLQARVDLYTRDTLAQS